MTETKTLHSACVFGVAALALLGTSAQADCSGIPEPPPSAGLEVMKGHVFRGDYDRVFETLQAPEATKRSVSDTLASLQPKGSIVRCITAKRIRQNPEFISEVFMTQSENGLLWWAVSGVAEGDRFELMNVWFTGNFDEIRGLLY